MSKFGKPDVIAGVATGAIGIGMLVADFLNLPFIYVRPEAKKHGRKNQIEGKIEPNQKVVVIEDLISTGKSSINAVRALRAQDIKVTGMVAIFTYGFDVSLKNFKNENIKLETLSNYKTLVEKQNASNRFDVVLEPVNSPDYINIKMNDSEFEMAQVQPAISIKTAIASE